MVERIYKYPLPVGDWVSVNMPVGAEPLTVQVQHGRPFLWARVTIDKPPALQFFRTAGTGHDLGSNVGRHIGSFQLSDGDLMFHVFAEQQS